MLSAVITVVSFVVMLLIIASLILSAWRAYLRHKNSIATKASQIPAHPLDPHVTAILHIQNGAIVNIEKPEPAQHFHLPASWYKRHRMLVSLGLILLLILTFFLQASFAGDTFHSLSQAFDISRYFQPTDLNTAAQPLPDTASSRLVRMDSTSRAQYHTDYQYNVWSYSSCSGMALGAVLNAYGQHLIGADVLQVELNLGVWSVQLGLLREDGIAMTADTYGFNTQSSHSLTLQDLITTSNKGTPIIVSVRDSYYYPGGHIFVVRGGDSQYVYIADSSPANFQRMTHAMFMGMWQGFSAIVTPR